MRGASILNGIFNGPVTLSGRHIFVVNNTLNSTVTGSSIFNVTFNTNIFKQAVSIQSTTAVGIGSDNTFHSTVSISATNTTSHGGTYNANVNITGNAHLEGLIFNPDISVSGDAAIVNSTFNGNTLLLKNGYLLGTNTFNNITFSEGYTYTLQSSQTQTINGTLVAVGDENAGFPLRIQASSQGAPAIIFKSSGKICLDYVRISDIQATGGALFYAGAAPEHSTDLGGNTGWLFEQGCLNIPSLSCIQNLIVQCTINSCSAIVDNISPTSNAAVDYSLSGATTGSGTGSVSGMIFNKGVTTVTYSLAADPSKSCSFTITVEDNQAPIPNLSSLPNITAECSVTLTTAPTAHDNCAGSITATTPDALSYNLQGTYTIHWTYTDGNKNTTPQNQIVIVKDVTPPVAPTLPDLTGECSVTATAPTAIDNCTGLIPGTTTDPVTYTTPGSYVIHWTFADGNGNGSTSTQNVIVSNISVPAIAGQSAVCAGSAIQLTNSYAGGVWSTSNSTVATTDNFGNVLGKTAGTVLITYTVTNGTCSNTVSKSVAVTALPQVFTVTGTSKCGGGTVTVGLSGSEVAVSYQLYVSNVSTGNPITGTGLALSFGSQTQPRTYTIKAISNTCSSLMSGQISLGAPTVYNVTGGNVCESSGITIGLSGSDVGSTYQVYLENNSVGTPLQGTGSTINFGPQTQMGTYTISATTPAGCKGTMIGSATYSNNPSVYNVTGGSQCGKSMMVGLDNSTSGITYELLLDNNVVDSKKGTGKGISFGLQKTSGTYTVKGVNAVGGCSSMMAGFASLNVNCIVAAKVAKEILLKPEVTIENKTNINVSPNPTLGQFIVRLNNFKSTKATVLLIEGNGKVIESRKVQLVNKSFILRYNNNFVASGVYLVKVISDDGVQTAKVIIQR